MSNALIPKGKKRIVTSPHKREIGVDLGLVCGYNISSIQEDAEQALSGWAGGALEDL